MEENKASRPILGDAANRSRFPIAKRKPLRLAGPDNLMAGVLFVASDHVRNAAAVIENSKTLLQDLFGLAGHLPSPSIHAPGAGRFVRWIEPYTKIRICQTIKYENSLATVFFYDSLPS